MIKVFLAFALFLTTIDPPSWITDMEYAKQLAKKEQKLILLNFSGSDWCVPCIRLRKEVFNTDAFANYAADHLVLVNADFPRQKKNQPAKEQQKINDALAERYNPQGSFPLHFCWTATETK
ncbi:MAG: thioredoxin family protein [Ginsengibacter sp.]